MPFVFIFESFFQIVTWILIIYIENITYIRQKETTATYVSLLFYYYFIFPCK